MQINHLGKKRILLNSKEKTCFVGIFLPCGFLSKKQGRC